MGQRSKNNANENRYFTIVDQGKKKCESVYNRKIS